MDRWHTHRGTGLASLLFVAGCASSPVDDPASQRVDVAPTSQPAAAEALQLDASQIEPMYREIIPVDLASVARVALADNFDVRRARENVRKAEGRQESVVGSAFPAIVPTSVFEHVDGTVRATEGDLVGVGFNTFQPAIAVQWVLNPGRVIYEIIAARKRLSASRQQVEAVILETLRKAVVQYYELVLAQARVSADHQAVSESEELLRINELRSRLGTGVLADELRAHARLAERQQDLALAIKAFYDASVSLAVTLHLDASSTLIPSIDELPPIRLVRDDLPIEALLVIAVTHRPDLASVRTIVEAIDADRGATWWGAFGPQFQVGYQIGGITGSADDVVDREGIPSNLIVNPFSANGSFAANPLANGLIREGIGRGSKRGAGRDNQTFGFSDQQRFRADVGWRLSLSAFGDLKAASASQQQALIEAERQLDQVRAEVVRASQASKTHQQLVVLAQQQVDAAAEALRLTEANLRAGTMTTLDVLQAQDDIAQARLRYAEAVVRYNQSQVNLLAALGMLDETQGLQSLGL